MAVGRKTGGGSRLGRPNKATAEIRGLARQYGEAAMAELARLAVEAESEAARVAACREILDRGYGKAMQPVGGDGEGGPVVYRIITGVPQVIYDDKPAETLDDQQPDVLDAYAR